MSVTVRPYRRGGWEVDVAFRLPNGQKYRERTKAPVSSKSGAARWGQDRERHLLRHGPEQPRKEVPTVTTFASRFIDDYAIARSHADAIKSALDQDLADQEVVDWDVQMRAGHLGRDLAWYVNRAYFDDFLGLDTRSAALRARYRLELTGDDRVGDVVKLPYVVGMSVGLAVLLFLQFGLPRMTKSDELPGGFVIDFPWLAVIGAGVTFAAGWGVSWFEPTPIGRQGATK